MQIFRSVSCQPWQCFALLLVLGFAGFNYYYHAGYAVDDAYISFRYLDNLLAGHGLVFNAGEKVEGYTNFLWILVLIPFRFLELFPETAGLIVNITCTILLFTATFRASRYLAGDSRHAGWISCILLAGYGSLIFWISAGMEPLLAATLVAWANLLIIKHRKLNTQSSILYGLAVLTRPDCLLFAIVTFLFFFPFKTNNAANQLKTFFLQSLIFISLPLLQMVFRWLYYDDLLPNTFYAKMHPDHALMWRFGIAYGERFLSAGGAIFIALSFVGFFTKRYRHQTRLISLLLTQFILYSLYIFKVGGDYMPFFRFFIPAIPVLALTAGTALWYLMEKRIPGDFASLVIAGAFSMGLTFQLFHSADAKQSDNVQIAHRDNEIFSQWLSKSFPKDSVLAMNLVGLIPYRTGMPVIDMLGLTDRHIARGKIARVRAATGTYVGHFKFDGDYVCSKEPDIFIPSTLGLHYAENPNQALWNTLRRSYDSDREFLKNPKCAAMYKPFVKELVPGKFIVIYLKN